MESNREQDERVMSVVSAALRLKPEEREPYIRIACQTDQWLYEEVLETLEWEQRMGGFLQQPVIALEELAHPFKAGVIISQRFEIVREIGEGAMGVVYEAFDRKRNQRIAIKCAKAGFQRLLSPELEGALRVRHPNVCLVNEIHAAQTQYGEIDFLTMELLEGEPLSARLSAGNKFYAQEARQIARQLVAGLAEAHRIGVIHRDLKSGNVMLCRNADGNIRAVITDFGLAGEMPQTDALCGTPRYIAPELWLGEKASKASDIYALGVILFEIIAGRPASGELHKSRTGAAGSPQAYSDLVAACLSLEPEKRCQGFERALQPDYWKRGEWTRRSVFAAGAGIVCALAAGAWLERDKIDHLFHPLPAKRFVALVLWPPTANARLKPLVSGVIDAIENELARTEAFDRNFFIISSQDVSSPGNQMKAVCESLGANLALAASGVAGTGDFQLILRVLDPSSNAVLRHRKIGCATQEVGSLPARAVREAAGLLNVRWERQGEGPSSPATNSALAFRAFQTAEELRKRTNDDGLNEAIGNYKIAIDADPNYSSAYAKLATAYSRLYELNNDAGALELAQANAEKAMSLDKKSIDAHLALAYVFEKRGNQKGALDETHRALGLDPKNPSTLLRQAQIYARFNRWTEAEQTYIRLRRERPNFWVAYNELGYVLNAQGKYQDAVEAFRAATVAAPASALAFNNLGALFLKLGRFDEAKGNFEKSLTLKPSDVAYSNLAEALRAEGRYAEALPLNQQAVKLEPSDDQNWLDLGDCYDALPGRKKEAHEAYLRAAAEIERRLQTDPTDGSAWIRLALYRAKARSPQDGTLFLTRAARFRVTDLDSELARARVLELLGKRRDALATLAGCFKRGTTQFEVASIHDFDNLRQDPGYARVQEPQ